MILFGGSAGLEAHKPKPGKPGQGKVGNLPSDDGKPNTNKEKGEKSNVKVYDCLCAEW